MNSEFTAYLTSMILGMAVIIMLPVLIVLQSRKNKSRNTHYKKTGHQEEIKSGNISIFFDRTGNAVIIPYARDSSGVGKATADIKILKVPYKGESLGRLIRQCMRACSTGSVCPDEELMKILGTPGWDKFSQGRRNISVHYIEGYGVVFNTTIRKADGVYELSCSGFEAVLPGSSCDRLIGDTVLRLLPRCKVS